MTHIDIWHSIIDQIAEYDEQHGAPPSTLKLPVRVAWHLAKLSPEHLGLLADDVLNEGIVAFEEAGLLGLKVTLVRDPAAVVELE